ncbi:MAG: response regulator transcription factor [Chthoniobacterales bacterium]
MYSPLEKSNKSRKAGRRDESVREYVVVADDHPVILRGLSQLINAEKDLEVIATISNARDLMETLGAVRPSLLLLDLGLGNADGLSVLKSVRAMHKSLPVLVFSMLDELDFAGRALTSGASGYVMKDNVDDQLLMAIRTVMKGETYLSPAVRQSHLGRSPESERFGVELLTDRELSVFRKVGMGRTTRSIAEDLFISVKTVEKHRENIKRKLGIESGNILCAEAAVYVWRSRGGVSSVEL